MLIDKLFQESCFGSPLFIHVVSFSLSVHLQDACKVVSTLCSETLSNVSGKILL